MNRLLVIGGLSGAGRTEAAASLEDEGWAIANNVPLEAADSVPEPLHGSSGRVALCVGAEAYAQDFPDAVAKLRRSCPHITVVFLDARSDVIVSRYRGTRRKHPLQQQCKAVSLGTAIENERIRLASFRDCADVVLDTSDLTFHDLRKRMRHMFASNTTKVLRVEIRSFGYKYGLPADADLVLDCTCIDNPAWHDDLQPLSGQAAAVANFVVEQPVTRQFLQDIEPLFAHLLAAYVDQGRSHVSVAIGCTGGRHRSVAVAERLAQLLTRLGADTFVTHRDIER